MIRVSSPRRILITGASGGIGAALALEYAQAGIFLFLVGRNEKRLFDVAQKVIARGAQVSYICADVRDSDLIHQWILTQDRAAPIDLIIANAGVSGGPRAGLETEKQVREIYDTNVQGVMNTILPILPRMKNRSAGQVAIVASLAGFAPWPGAPSYCGGKAALITHGLALRIALAKNHVAVNVICPGFIDTPMTRVNAYKMPWLMTAPDAAKAIRRGLSRNKPIIAFPWQASIVARLIGIMPYGIQQIILAKTPSKPPLND